MFGIRKYAVLFLMGGIILSISSCTENIGEELPTTLKISESDVIQVGSQGGEYDITVSTNAPKWIAVSSNSWAVTKTDENTLHIKINSNETTGERSAQVQINAKEITQKVIIQQEGKALRLDTESAVTFGQFGGEKRFYLDASSDDWTAVSSSPWVTVNQRTAQGEIVISTEETKDRDDRNATIEFKDKNGQTVSSIEVTQTGILYFFLPYMGYGVDTETVRVFENSRYNTSSLPPAPNPSGTVYYFETVSPVFPLIRYLFNNGKYTSATLYTKNRTSEPLEGNAKEELVAFLRQNGFEDDGDGNSFVNEGKNNEARIITNSANPNISFRFVPPQRTPLPTFETLPLGNTNFYRTHREGRENIVDALGDNAEKIKAYEKSKGWKFIPPYDPYAKENRNDSYIERERKRDEYSRQIRVPLFFGAWRQRDFRYFYEYMVFEKDGQYRAYRLDRVYEKYINNYIDEDDELYGEESIRVGDTGMSVTWQTFRNISKFLYFENGAPTLSRKVCKLKSIGLDL